MHTEFHYKKTEHLNPYIGFTSFQHFCGDPLYTDSVVIPGRNNIETEDFECYPVAEGIGEEGNSQGFYPDSSVAYIRALWRDFEPERGKYNYDFIEKILRTAEKRGQTVMFRLMQHSTCARDDVPDWLREIIDCPTRPDGARFKDSPRDPQFIYLFCEAVKALGARFDSDPTLDIVDISTVGAWGEGHQRELYDHSLLEYMIDTYTSAFPTTQLLCQMSSPELLERARNGGKRRIGTRADALGQPAHRYEVYPMFLKNLPKDLWKEAPISAESFYWLGEWKRQGWDARDTFDYMLSLHISTFNGKYLPIPFEWREDVDYLLERMGYHFVIDSFECTDCVTDGKLSAVLSLDNRGNAPIYHAVPLKVRLKSEKSEYVIDTGVDIRGWVPGKTDVPLALELPDGLAAGEYTVSVALTGGGYPDVYFESDAERDGVWFEVGKTTIK